MLESGQTKPMSRLPYQLLARGVRRQPLLLLFGRPELLDGTCDLEKLQGFGGVVGRGSVNDVQHGSTQARRARHGVGGVRPPGMGAPSRLGDKARRSTGYIVP